MQNKRALERLVHVVRCTVYEHYEKLLNELEITNEDRKARVLVHLEVLKAHDSAVVEGFHALVDRFFPDAISSSATNPGEPPKV